MPIAADKEEMPLS